MKKMMLAALSALALSAAAPAYAANGYIGADYENVDPSGAEDVNGFGIEGAVTYDTGPTVGVDVLGLVNDFEDVDATVAAVGSVYAKGGDYRFGGFLGLADQDETSWLVGLQGSKQLSGVTLVGAFGYSNTDDTDTDSYTTAAQARFLATQNLRFHVTGAYIDVEQGNAEDNAWLANVGGEWQVEGTPFSIYADVGRTEFDESDIEATAWRLGGRYVFGGTQADREANGPIFADIQRIAFLGY